MTGYLNSGEKNARCSVVLRRIRKTCHSRVLGEQSKSCNRRKYIKWVQVLEPCTRKLYHYFSDAEDVGNEIMYTINDISPSSMGIAIERNFECVRIHGMTLFHTKIGISILCVSKNMNR